MNVVTNSQKSIFDRMEREVVDETVDREPLCSLIKFVDVVWVCRVGGMELRRIGNR